MLELIHHPVCPHSRFVRLVLLEYDLPVDLIGERIWERREEFLKLNPAGTLPVLLVDGQAPIPGVSPIAEYLDEAYGDRFNNRLLPPDPYLRIEVRRLMSWFHSKFFAEVSGILTTDRYRQYTPAIYGGGSPDYAALRIAHRNIPDHLKYIDLLVSERLWLAGDQLTYADLAAAAHLSAIHNLDELPWNGAEKGKAWFTRIRSQRSFRSMLTASWKGFIRN
jgi:glutathione S-transferase